MYRCGWMVLLPLGVVSLAGCNGADSTVAPPKPPEIDVSLPVSDTLTDFEVFTGRTQALNSVDLKARVTGYLEQAPFRQGEDVKKGDILFVIQQNSFEAALKQAKATRDQQKAMMEYNETVYQRNRNLTNRNAVSTEDLQQTRANRDSSKAAYEAAIAAVAIAQQNYDWTVIRAPFDGRISRRLVDVGNDVMADTTVLASLVQLDKLYAYFDVDERTLLSITDFLPQGKVPAELNQKLPVKLGLANEKPEDFAHDGALDFVDNRVDANTGTLRMWGIFNNPKFDLKPGLFIRVRMNVGKPRQAFFVAETALGSDQGHKYLYVVNEENKVVYTPVTVGQRKNGLIAIEHGLKGDERIVVNGLQRVKQQMEVKPKVISMPRTDVQATNTPVVGLKPMEDKGQGAARPADKH